MNACSCVWSGVVLVDSVLITPTLGTRVGERKDASVCCILSVPESTPIHILWYPVSTRMLRW